MILSYNEFKTYLLGKEFATATLTEDYIGEYEDDDELIPAGTKINFAVGKWAPISSQRDDVQQLESEYNLEHDGYWEQYYNGQFNVITENQLLNQILLNYEI